MKVYRVFDYASEPGRLACKLRGEHVFDYINTLEDFPFEVDPWAPLTDDGHPQVHFPRSGVPAVVFADLDIVVDLEMTWGELVERGDILLIVDVHFPLGAVRSSITAIQPGRNADTRDPAADEIARDRWENPARIDRARRILNQAHIITSPRRSWAALLAPLPIRVLPDVTDSASAAKFFMNFARATDVAAVNAFISRLSRGQRFKMWAMRAYAAVLGFGVERGVRKEFEQADIDWSYAGEATD